MSALAAELYHALVPGPHEGEERLLRAALGGARGPLLDIGGGTGRLVRCLAAIAGPVGVIDIDAAALAFAVEAGAFAICADMGALPFADASMGGAVAGMLALNHAGSREAFVRSLAEAARVLRPGAILMADLATAWRPRCLQGLAEEHRSPSQRFTFRYHDVLESDGDGAVLASELLLRVGDREASLRASLFVPAVEALAPLAASAGLRLLRLHPPYDAEESTLAPPPDCLRAIAILEAKGIP